MATAEELVRQSLERCIIPDNVTVTVDIPEALPWLNIDSPQMGQVLMNFITNGMQAMPDGGRIEVESRLGEGTSFTVLLPVERKIGGESNNNK